ncbi:MAG: endonuclease/exonuclease/phosphatase family protein [Thermoanaerobacteraceae bacterium]|nr:endonuclease/exonuclease/phosphatase family protein [Thermoanaerobacteraceae bacterium]
MKKTVVFALILFIIISFLPDNAWTEANFRVIFEDNGPTSNIFVETSLLSNNIPVLYEGKGVSESEVLTSPFEMSYVDVKKKRFVLNVPEGTDNILLYPYTNREKKISIIMPEIFINPIKKEFLIKGIDESIVNIRFILQKGGTYTIQNVIKNGKLELSYKPLENVLKEGTTVNIDILSPTGYEYISIRRLPYIAVNLDEDWLAVTGYYFNKKLPKLYLLDEKGRTLSAMQVEAWDENGYFEARPLKNIPIKAGYEIYYKEDFYNFKFTIPEINASLEGTKNLILYSSRNGAMMLKIDDRILKISPDEDGLYKYTITGNSMDDNMIEFNVGYISEAGNEFWQTFKLGQDQEDQGTMISNLSFIEGKVVNGLRVMSYNIHHGATKDGEDSIDKIAALIKEVNADIIGLQEVDRFAARSNFKDQVKMLAEKTGMEYIFGKTVNVPTGITGNAILSRYPIIAEDNFLLPSLIEQRAFILGRIDINGEEIEVGVSHLGLNNYERIKQAETVKSIVNSLNKEYILIGDLNSTYLSREVRTLSEGIKDTVKASSISANTFAYGSPEPNVRIDYIFTSNGFDILSHKVINVNYSDHMPVVADVIIKNRENGK